MAPFGNIKGVHRAVRIEAPGRPAMRMLCLVQKDGNEQDSYYVLAESDASAIKWRSTIRDNTVRRLKDELRAHIVAEEDADSLDVETIFLCTTEASKHS